MYCLPRAASHESFRSVRSSRRPQTPPLLFILSSTVVIPVRTGPRKLEPGPSATTVAASLMDDADTPTSVLPPLEPAAQERLTGVDLAMPDACPPAAAPAAAW